MDDSSTVGIIRQECAGWFGDRRLYRGLWSQGLILYDRMARRMHWRRFRWRGRLAKVRLRGHPQPFAIRVGSSDTKVLSELFQDGEYAGVLAHELGEVKQIVDLGSNAGYSLRFWHHHFPQAHIVGVEPDEGNVAMCRHNLAFLSEAQRMQFALVRACVAAESGEVYLRTDVEPWSYHMQHEPDGNTTATPALAMQEILEQASATATIDLLKCDIEGAERELFSHCSTWIDRIRAMVVELHKDVYDVSTFLQDLKGNGWFPAGHRVLAAPYHTLIFVWRDESVSS